MSGIGAAHKLEGGDFVRFIVDEDKQVFKDFIAHRSELVKTAVSTSSDKSIDAPVIGGPAAVHVSLKDAMGSVFRVEIIHTHLANFDEVGHLLGVRDLGDHGRETRIDGNTMPFRLGEQLYQTNHLHSSASMSSESDSFSIEDNQDRGDAIKCRSLSMLFNVFDQTLPIIEATASFQKLSEEDDVERQNNALPTLSTWLSSRHRQEFQHWAQTAANYLSYGERAPSYGPVAFKQHMSARRALAVSMQGDAVQVKFEDVRLPDVLRKRKSALASILEAAQNEASVVARLQNAQALLQSRSQPPPNRRPYLHL
eukprot:TRINITY_DN38481_c0_g1_i1.p1 TRINITY_DN38481_c0_g1~~TRINITY_DN38481_c0_g1_i1.p1  ORF type:complete len:311 (-),score=40.01 TRINITY_DN38481_c0_g1_i1:208-1140(-)